MLVVVVTSSPLFRFSLHRPPGKTSRHIFTQLAASSFAFNQQTALASILRERKRKRKSEKKKRREEEGETNKPFKTNGDFNIQSTRFGPKETSQARSSRSALTSIFLRPPVRPPLRASPERQGLDAKKKKKDKSHLSRHRKHPCCCDLFVEISLFFLFNHSTPRSLSPR